MKKSLSTNDIIRIPAGMGGYKVYRVTGVLLGASGQEGHYQLRPISETLGNSVEQANVESLVPILMLDTHPDVETVYSLMKP